METTPTASELNISVAKEVFGQTSRPWTNPKIPHWYSRDGQHIGPGVEPPNNCSRNIAEAFTLLDRWGWTLHTCDAGYHCQIHESPERGEVVLGAGVADTPMKAICIAALQANKFQPPLAH